MKDFSRLGELSLSYILIAVNAYLRLENKILSLWNKAGLFCRWNWIFVNHFSHLRSEETNHFCSGWMIRSQRWIIQGFVCICAFDPPLIVPTLRNICHAAFHNRSRRALGYAGVWLFLLHGPHGHPQRQRSLAGRWRKRFDWGRD